MPKFEKIFFYLFAALLFFVPIILWPYTSEVFEFNKIVLVYILTAALSATWILKSFTAGKFIFRRTILDIPLAAFLIFQFISTIVSVDITTSWFGYYSRFNGGLFSTVCYSLLYWIFVSNINSEHALKLLRIALTSASLVCLYAVAEHFGIDKNIWVQDVQSRVFSTLGQPNWLAAWVAGLIPITWAFSLFKNKWIWLYPVLYTLLFITLLFTKSRSGLIGFALAFVIFWGYNLAKHKSETLKQFVLAFILTSVSALIIGTQFTPSLSSFLGNRRVNSEATTAPSGPALEVGGTESGTIRKIVWKGAMDIWAHYPIFGTGVETFAYTYYQFRPKEHNLVSEWDFIYNKAHNEFLNIAANTGSFGFISYLIMLGVSIYIFSAKLFKKPGTPSNNDHSNILNTALLSGYSSLIITNFFGFSVVPTQLQLFLFPAFALTFSLNDTIEKRHNEDKFKNPNKFVVYSVLFFLGYLLFLISRYWYADYLYNFGKTYNGSKLPDKAIPYLVKAADIKPNQALYHIELANAYTNAAVFYQTNNDAKRAKDFSLMAIAESSKAVALSPANPNLQRSRFGIFITLSTIDPAYIAQAQESLLAAIKLAPTDAKLYYNLGLVYARIGKTDDALKTLEKTIDLKANYKDARLAYAYLLIEKKQNLKAKEQLEYILTNIDPNDSLSKQALDGI